MTLTNISFYSLIVIKKNLNQIQIYFPSDIYNGKMSLEEAEFEQKRFIIRNRKRTILLYTKK